MFKDTGLLETFHIQISISKLILFLGEAQCITESMRFMCRTQTLFPLFSTKRLYKYKAWIFSLNFLLAQLTISEDQDSKPQWTYNSHIAQGLPSILPPPYQKYVTLSHVIHADVFFSSLKPLLAQLLGNYLLLLGNSQSTINTFSANKWINETRLLLHKNIIILYISIFSFQWAS